MANGRGNLISIDFKSSPAARGPQLSWNLNADSPEELAGCTSDNHVYLNVSESIKFKPECEPYILH
jgi:hypothetical protein